MTHRLREFLYVALIALATGCFCMGADLGQPCATGDDCCSSQCNSGVCVCGKVGDGCSESVNCCSLQCNGTSCQCGPPGAPCSDKSQCCPIVYGYKNVADCSPTEHICYQSTCVPFNGLCTDDWNGPEITYDNHCCQFPTEYVNCGAPWLGENGPKHQCTLGQDPSCANAGTSCSFLKCCPGQNTTCDPGSKHCVFPQPACAGIGAACDFFSCCQGQGTICDATSHTCVKP